MIHSRFSPAVRDMRQMRRAKMMELMKHGAFPYDYARNGGSTSSGVDASDTTAVARLPIDIWLEDDVYTFRANLPGFTPEDVEITFEDGELLIRAEHALEAAANIDDSAEDDSDEEVEDDGLVYIRREIFSGAYERKLSFNSPVDSENIAADFEHGVLTISVPKAEEAKPKQIAVNAKSKNSKKK